MRPFWIAMAALAAWMAGSHAALAQARDGVYRGTLVCSGDAMPQPGRPRVAIEISIKGNEITYQRPVVEQGQALGSETGTGKLESDKLTLSGSWRGDKLGFDASYDGTFVRRVHIRFAGSQNWTRDGKTTVRKCSGSAKRPLFFRRKSG